MADVIPLSEMPTLSSLYKQKRIVPSEELDTSTLPAPNAAFNDKISVLREDITTLAVDSIVNAANNSLLGGGGVDGAIHRAAGPELYDECETLEGCETGSAKITDGYELPAKKVIHAVGPIYWSTKQQGKPAELLSGCYRKSLELAVDNGLKSIAFSALSTGVYGYPSEEASHVALNTVRKFLEEGKGDEMERIIFCNFMQKDEDAYFENIPQYFPPVVSDLGSENSTEEESQLQEEETKDKERGRDLATKLPDAPTTEPNSPEAVQPSPKKQKIDVSEDDFELLDKEEIKEAKDAEAEAKAASKVEL